MARQRRQKRRRDAAVEAMRRTFDAVPFDGRVAIGEGERDEAPMLFIGEELEVRLVSKVFHASTSPSILLNAPTIVLMTNPTPLLSCGCLEELAPRT